MGVTMGVRRSILMGGIVAGGRRIRAWRTWTVADPDFEGPYGSAIPLNCFPVAHHGVRGTVSESSPPVSWWIMVETRFSHMESLVLRIPWTAADRVLWVSHALYAPGLWVSHALYAPGHADRQNDVQEIEGDRRGSTLR